MKYFCSLLFFIGVVLSSSAQDLNMKLPVDPDVKIGKLNNGLTYYIRHNEKPNNKIELRLVVNAGSILETDAQQGIAHLSEHMAFNGTKHFKKNDIVSYLQTIGVGFGNDLNAYTSFNETVYILPIPTDNPENITKGFQILQDWAENVTYNDSDIDAERPVVLEESRLGKGANDRMMKQILPHLLAGSQYAKRLPIGKDSIIKHASYATVKSFYKEWYRPDLMAVIVVGDIDTKKAEALVKKYFSGLKNPAIQKPRKEFSLPPYSKSVAKVATDKEATSYLYLVNYSAVKKTPEVTLGNYKNDLIKNIFITLLNQRLREVTQQPNPPFVSAFGSFGSDARGYDAFMGYIMAGSNPDLRALSAFDTETERIKKYGFLQTELDRVKAQMLSRMETVYNERDKTNSSNYTSEYISNFLEKEPIPGVSNEYKYYKELLPKISLADVNNISKILQENKHEFIGLLGPDAKEGITLPTPQQILNVGKEVAASDIKPYEEKAIASTLLAEKPVAGKITGTSVNQELGTTTYTLSNNVKVTIKKTNFKNDQILMTAVRPGGKSNYTATDKYDAEYMIPVIASMGIGQFSPVDLRKALSGKTVNVMPQFTDISDGFSGNSSVKDFKSMLELTYLYFTSPRIDTALFKSYIEKSKSQLAFLSANPQVLFIDSLFNVVYHNSPLAPIAIPKSEYYDKIHLDKVMDIYKNEFQNANGMHFYFVGNIDPDTTKSLIETYIAGLPSTPGEFSFTDTKLRPVNGDHEVDVYKGKDPKALILRLYTGEKPYSQKLNLAAKAVSEILNIEIIETLREKIGGIYGGGTNFSFEKYPYQNYTMMLQLPCGPEKIDTLISAFDDLVKDLVAKGPSQENVEKVRKQWIEAHKVDIKENGVWLSQLKNFEFLGNNPDYFINYDKYVNALTPEEIQKAAAEIFSTTNVVTGILRPEKN
ncbi:MAG: insulinase family protein [Chitinophagaceae bacterium]|nr:insulinase family protein [Chitinophagaceae bacterium]